MAAQGKSVTILCSYVTLGTYIPALILHREFKQKGFDSELIALEQLFPDNKLDEIPKLKKAIHNNFKLAKTALKMASKNNSASFDENKVKALFSDWNEKKRNHFIVFTGFWSEIINRFIGNAASYQDIQVDLVHMDSESSPSWKSYETSYGNIRLIKLFDAARKQLHGYIPPAENQFTNIRSKKDRILVHGGGWGIGTYKEKVFEMVSHKLRLNVVAYEPADMQCDNESIQYHLLDPQWKPYNGQFYTFPPIRRMGAVEKEYGSDDGYYPYYNLVLDSCVILSKPGGGTQIGRAHV